MSTEDITQTFTAEEVIGLVNTAIEDIDTFADIPDEGARDALNLLVNVVGVRLEKPSASVEDVIGTNYDADPETVREWIEA